MSPEELERLVEAAQCFEPLDPELILTLVEELRAHRVAAQPHPFPEHDLPHFVCVGVRFEDAGTVLAYEPLEGAFT